MCPADVGDALKPRQSFGEARVSYLNYILYGKNEAAEVGKRKKYANCSSMDWCIDFLKIIADSFIWDFFQSWDTLHSSFLLVHVKPPTY